MYIHLDEKSFECNRCLKQYATKAVLINPAKLIHPHQVDDIIQRKRAAEPDKEVKAMMAKCENEWICKSCGKRAK